MCIIISPCIITHVINRIIIIINRDLLHRQKLEIYRNIYIYFFYYYFFPQAIGITYYLLIFNYTIATFSCYVCKAAFETICKKEEKKNACSAHIYVPSGLIISFCSHRHIHSGPVYLLLFSLCRLNQNI